MRVALRSLSALVLCPLIVLAGCDNGFSTLAGSNATAITPQQAIKHVVVIFDENESYDHYFGTYPNAANLAGETVFTAAAGTPSSNNYLTNPALLTQNPNASNGTNGGGAINPFRMAPSQAFANTQDHSYNPEQLAFNGGAMDLFPYSVGAADSAALAGNAANATLEQTTGLTMGYFDGNTVTALWNYAQHYAMSDAYHGTTFGGSTLGAINVISGQTNGVVNDAGSSADMVSDGNGGNTLTDDSDPTGDTCSGSSTVHMTGKNVGDLLTTAGVSWGWFQGGFDLTKTNLGTNTTGCHRKSYVTAYPGPGTFTTDDYVPRHEPFQFYTSTANPTHKRPTSTAAIGTNADQANHQYDSDDFITALNAGNMPAVSFLKPPAYQDSHASNSDPLDEQTWIVTMVNAIEQSTFWPNTAIIIAYDDSDGWYDHAHWVVNGSNTVQDAAICNTATGSAAPTAALGGVNPATTHAQGRCGHGPRLPFLVISPWVNKNTIHSTQIDQTTITRLIEDIFINGQRIGGGSYDAIANDMLPVFNFTSATPPNPNVVTLDHTTGLVTSGN